MTQPHPMKPSRARLINIGLVIGSTLIGLFVCEVVLRRRLEQRVFYAPRGAVNEIQAQLVLEPSIGYTWRQNLKYEDNVVIRYDDVVLGPLSTDAHGFLNAPEAIAQTSTSQRAFVVGVGDSFMEHAHGVFFDVFKSQGLSYYNLAIHRQCPPQYNRIIDNYAKPLKPNWVVYGLFENDFIETEDFDAWSTSGVDWFTYHSGFWCGPPLGATAQERFVKTYLRGFYSAYHLMQARERAGRISAAGPTDAQIDAVRKAVNEACHAVPDNGMNLVLVIIPSRDTATKGPTPESIAMDRVIRELTGRHELIDLRPVFQEHANPASLYYAQDAHWNEAGMTLAGQTIVYRIQERQSKEQT